MCRFSLSGLVRLYEDYVKLGWPITESPERISMNVNFVLARLACDPKFRALMGAPNASNPISILLSKGNFHKRKVYIDRLVKSLNLKRDEHDEIVDRVFEYISMRGLPDGAICK